MSDERTLGDHEARITIVEENMREMRGDVKKILEHVAANKGGWKAITALGSASGILGAIVAEFFTRRG